MKQRLTKEHKEKIGKTNSIKLKGHIVTVETRNKISTTMKKNGYKPKKLLKKGEHCNLNTEWHKGHIPWNKGMKGQGKGKKLSEDTKRKISETRKLKMKKYGFLNSVEMRKKISGPNSYMWKGGISTKPYSIDWTTTLKQSIRERDNYTCFLCGKKPSLNVHHIDYNKLNSNPSNLITLCNSCHISTNHNRNNWTQYFKEKLQCQTD